MAPLESPKVNNHEERQRVSKGKSKKNTAERKKRKTNESSVFAQSQESER